MASIAYLLALPDPDTMPSRTLLNGVAAMAINAESTADAVAFAKGQFENDVDAMWDAATITAIAADSNLNGWSFRLKVVGAYVPPSGTDEAYVGGYSPAPVFDQTVTATGLVETETAAVAATQTLTNDGTDVGDTEAVTVGGKTYTFQTVLTNVDGNVLRGVSNTASMTALFHAINASGGTPGVDYAAATTANANVTATNPTGTTVVVTAKVAGAAGNSIASTETSAHLSWGAAVLAGGADAVTSTDEISSLAELMVAALNASTVIDHAAFNPSTHVLTVAGTADSLGDHRVVAIFSHPLADPNVAISIPGFVASKTDAGSAGAALSLTLAADTYTPPTIVAQLGATV